MEKAGGAVVAIITGIIGLAIVAVIFSSHAQTPSVISASGKALSQVIGAAVSPVVSPSSGGSSGSILGSAGSTLGGLGSSFGSLGSLGSSFGGGSSLGSIDQYAGLISAFA